MGSSPPRIVGFATNHGTPGSVVLTSIVGTSLEAVRRVYFSGSGVRAKILRPPRRDMIDVAISIAADAPPGSRTVRLSPARNGAGTARSSRALFYIVGRSSYGGISGIGSHLI